MPLTIRPRQRAFRTRNRSTPKHTRSFELLAQKPHLTAETHDKKLGIPARDSKQTYSAASTKLNALLARARNLLEQNKHMNQEEMAIRLGLTARTAKLVWMNIPRVKQTMEWEQKKKKRR